MLNYYYYNFGNSIRSYKIMYKEYWDSDSDVRKEIIRCLVIELRIDELCDIISMSRSEVLESYRSIDVEERNKFVEEIVGTKDMDKICKLQNVLYKDEWESLLIDYRISLDAICWVDDNFQRSINKPNLTYENVKEFRKKEKENHWEYQNRKEWDPHWDLYSLQYTLKDIDIPNSDGVYVVVFSMLNKNVLVYNYIYYPAILTDFLSVYFITKEYMEYSVAKRDFVNYCSIVDDALKTDATSYLFKDYKKFYNSIPKKPKSGKTGVLLFMLDLMKNNSIVSNINTMSSLICYGLRHDYFEFFKICTTGMFFDKEENKAITVCEKQFKPLTKKALVEEINDNIFLPRNCVFIVKNLKGFLDKIDKYTKKSNINVSVNEGPQKNRGRVNSLSSKLSLIDFDIRNGLYKHTTSHLNRTAETQNVSLIKPKYSFKNIHNRLGNNRYYSTKKQKLSTCAGLVRSDVSTSLVTSKNEGDDRKSYNRDILSSFIIKNVKNDIIIHNRSIFF